MVISSISVCFARNYVFSCSVIALQPVSRSISHTNLEFLIEAEQVLVEVIGFSFFRMFCYCHCSLFDVFLKIINVYLEDWTFGNPY